jgi:hypothetical protein
MSFIQSTWNKITGRGDDRKPARPPTTGKATQSKAGAGPAIAAHSKDAAATSSPGQNPEAAYKKSDH